MYVVDQTQVTFLHDMLITAKLYVYIVKLLRFMQLRTQLPQFTGLVIYLKLCGKFINS